MSSRPILDVNGETLSRLKAVMALVDDRESVYASKKPLTLCGYAIENGRLAFFQYDHPKMIPLPVPLTLDDTAVIAFNWVQAQDYGPEPDMDGSVSKGWRCFREDWGHISPYGYSACVAVSPLWMEYGK